MPPRRNIVKICSIIGLVLGLAYTFYVVLAPNYDRDPVTRMLFPKSSIPKDGSIAPGTPPPLSAKIKRILIAGFFMGPFGMMAGCGVGLLLEGARQSLTRRKEPPQN